MFFNNLDRGKSTEITYFSGSSIIALLIEIETESARQDVLNTFLQTDVVVSAPVCLYIHHFPGTAVELFYRPKGWHFNFAYEFAPCHTSLFLYLYECRIILRAEDRVRSCRERDRRRRQEWVEQDVQQSTRVGMRNIHVVLAVSDEKWNVDVVDDGKRVELVSNELLDQS